MHDCCNQGRAMIEGSQVPLPLFCSFYFRTSKQGQILYRIIEGIIITFGPLSHFCSPSPTFCSPSPTFGSSSPTFFLVTAVMHNLCSMHALDQVRFCISRVWQHSNGVDLEYRRFTWKEWFNDVTNLILEKWSSSASGNDESSVLPLS